MTLTSNNSKPIIQKIKLSKEQQEIADKLCKGIASPTKKLVTNKLGQTYEFTTNKTFSQLTAKSRLRKIYGGLCCVCGQWPDYKVVYDMEGAKRIERYCQKCFDNNKMGIKK